MQDITKSELRSIQLGLLGRFDEYCREENLIYYLAYGTLLGAVRHGGYIPWDDDIDVMMPRPAYRRFLSDFPSSDHAEGTTLGSHESLSAWPYPYAKLMDDRTCLIEDAETDSELGVNIDIFPIDPAPESDFLLKGQRVRLRIYRRLLDLKLYPSRQGRPVHKRLLAAPLKPFVRRVSIHRVVAKYSACAQCYSPRSTCEVGVRVGSFDWLMPAHWLGRPGELEFEGRRLLSPASPERVLERLYGDYLQLPPIERRTSTHKFRATWRAVPSSAEDCSSAAVEEIERD